MDPANRISRLRLERNRLNTELKIRVKEVDDELVRCHVSKDEIYISSYTDDPVEICLDSSVNLTQFYADHFINSRINFILRHSHKY